MKRGLLVLLLIAGVAAGGAWYIGLPGGPAAANAPAWRTATVDRAEVIAAVNATGAINPLSTVVVGSQVSGQVIQLLADYNSEVEEGAIMARLDATQIRARLDASRADLANVTALRAVQEAQIEQVKAERQRVEATRLDAVAKLAQVEAQLAEADRVLGRQNELGARGFAASAAIDTARTSVQSQRAARDSARAQIASAEAARLGVEANLKVATAQLGAIDAQIAQRSAVVRQIEVDLANTEIKSPVKGTVVQRQIELGQTVAASLQAPTLFLVAQDLRSMEIYANVDEADVGRVKPGQRVTFTVNSYPNRTFEAQVKLVRLGSQTVQNVVIYTAVISVENPRLELLPGMTATLRVITDRREQALRVPNAALRWRPAGTAPEQARPQQTSNPFAPSPLGAGPGGSPVARGPGGGGPGGGGPGRQMAEFVETVKTELRLSASQREQLDAVVAETWPRFATVMDPSLDRAARIERIREIRADMARRIEGLLTEPQRQGFAEIRARYGEQARGGGQGTPGRVFVVGPDGQAQAVQLRLGVTDGAYTEVVAGELEPGRAVIVGGGSAAASQAQRGFRMF